MNSLHLCTSDSWGGLELYAATIMTELAGRGHGVTAICRPGSRMWDYLSGQGIRPEALPSGSTISRASVRFLKNLLGARSIGAAHVHFHRDIWNISLAMRGDRHRKLFLGVYMGVGRKTDILHRFIYGRVDGVFTSSHELMRRLPVLYPIPASKIHFLPYGRKTEMYSTDHVRRAEIRARYGIGRDDILAGTMVRIDPGKGVIDFVKSLVALEPGLRSRVRYLIVGEPTRKSHTAPGESPFEEHCEAYIGEIRSYIRQEGLGQSIILAGYQQDLIGYLSAMDIFVFPSRDELYSLVVLDAMGMGLPVIAAAAGGNLDQVSDGVSGLLYPVADSAALAGRIAEYCRSETLRKRHGDAAREFVLSHHSMDNTISQLLEYYTA